MFAVPSVLKALFGGGGAATFGAGASTATRTLPVPVPHFEEQYLERPLPPQREIVGAAAAAERSSIEQFEREGFLVIRNFLTPEKVAASKERLQHILDNWQQGRQPGKGSPDEAPITPLVDLDQDFRTGKLPMPAETIDATRRFFRMVRTRTHPPIGIALPADTCRVVARVAQAGSRVLRTLRAPGRAARLPMACVVGVCLVCV